MNWEEIKYKFPACMHTIKMPDISKFKLETIEVFRACIDNKIDENAFLPTYLDPLQRDIIKNKQSPTFYSMSVFSNEKDAFKIMKFLSKNKSRPYILGKGKTSIAQEIWEKSCEWDTSHKKDSHYDYWLYEKNDVYKDFSEYIME